MAFGAQHHFAGCPVKGELGRQRGSELAVGLGSRFNGKLARNNAVGIAAALNYGID